MFESKNFTFINEQGLKLAATLEMPVNCDPKAYAIFAHCFGCGKDVLAATRISRELTHEGLAVLRFDFTGIGASSGEFENTNFSTNVSDLVCAAKYLRDNYQAPKLLIGHSLGGAAAIVASSLIPEVRAIATIGTPSYPGHVSHLFTMKEGDEIAPIKIAGKELKIKKQFLEDVEKHDLAGILKNSNCALLIFHSPTDQIVGITQARYLFEAAKHPKNFISLDQADHMLSSREDAGFVARMIAIWARRYVCQK